MILTQLANFVFRFGIWILLILAVIAFLPDGASHPLPVAITTAFVTAFAYFFVLNEVMPVDTFLLIMGISVGIKLALDLVFPAVMKIINILTRLFSSQ